MKLHYEQMKIFIWSFLHSFEIGLILVYCLLRDEFCCSFKNTFVEYEKFIEEKNTRIKFYNSKFVCVISILEFGRNNRWVREKDSGIRTIFLYCVKWVKNFIKTCHRILESFQF